MTRWLVLLAAGVTLACAANAGAQTYAQKAPPAPAQKKAPAAHELPLHLYLAKGEANACGEGCSEWIAVEGSFDAGAAGRAQAFLKRYGARKLPVYLHSPGGHSNAAMAIGRQLRQMGITAGVGATIPRGCESAYDQSKACSAAKRTGQPVAADWRPDANCSSACVWTLLGAKVRHVPPGARLGVHATRFTLVLKYSSGRVQQVSPHQAMHKARAAEAIASTRRYIREMGGDPALLDTAQKTPHEDINYLTRDQIAAFGIDRREFAETPWFFAQFSNANAYVGKWIVEARGPERKDYRVSVIMIGCSSASRATLRYVRGLASNETGRATTATFSIGKQKIRLPLNGESERNTIDTGGVFSSGGSYVPFADVEAVASEASMRVIESDPRLDTKLFNVIELSTHGLGEGIKRLRERCGQTAQPASWRDNTQIPYVPAPKGDSAIPAAPYGAYPAPELGLDSTGGRKKK
jgi:hypothetical protein